MHRLLTSAQTAQLRQHRYSCDNQSILDPWMQPWWSFVVQLMPMWVAPNLITFVGLLINVLTSLIYLSFAPNAVEDVPGWIPTCCGLGLFIYQTLDAIDGKQARRTNHSNALGELFDHGCDCVSTVMVALVGCCMLRLGGSPYLMLYQCFSGIFLFYLAHWQTYVTGTMRFGKFDVTEAQFCMMALLFVTAAFGSGIWDIHMLGVLPLRWLPVIFATLAAGFGLPAIVDKILFGGAGRNGSTVAGTSVISPVVPVLLVAFPGWYVATESDLFVRNPIVFNLTFGLIGTKITNKLIVAQMTKSEMQILDSTMVVPVSLVALILLGVSIPHHLHLYLALVVVLFDLVWYCIRVCREICLATGWPLFTISHSGGPSANSGQSSISQVPLSYPSRASRKR